MVEEFLVDPYFTVEVSKDATSPNPQRAIYNALHQDYSSRFVRSNFELSEKDAGEIAVKRLLKGDRGHFGCLEHPQLMVTSGWFPHSVIQQVRTHRIMSFDVQSFRYTGSEIADLGKLMFNARDEDIHHFYPDVEQYFYLRPVGFYTNRKGVKYEYTEDRRSAHLKWIAQCVINYYQDNLFGMSEENCRDLIAAGYRQHFVMSGNLRSWLHFIDVRLKKDVQLETRTFANMCSKIIADWVPEIWTWYEVNRLGKAKLAP